jgi:hypothetical protein
MIDSQLVVKDNARVAGVRAFLRARTMSLRFAAAASILLFAGNRALAQADINNGIVRVGVSPLGSMGVNPAINTPVSSAGPGSVSYVTLRYMPTNCEADSGGVLEERWGVADTLTSQSGGSLGGGNTNLVAGSFTSTASSAVATVTAAGVFQVTHDFHPSSHPNVYEITVTIQNISASSVNVRYRRAFQWDIEPTRFQEFITLQGSSQPGVLSFTDLGNAAVNPMTAPPGTSGDVVNQGPGPTMSGFTLTLDLGTLAPGGSTVNRFYYGATGDRASAVSAVTSLGISVYALGHPDTTPANAGTPNTFLFGFIAGPPAAAPAPPPAPTPPPAPPPAPAEGPEGNYTGSSSGASSAEGGFGFGNRHRSPILLPPVSGESGTAWVLNVAHRQPTQPLAANDSTTPAWATAATGLVLALGALLILAKKGS